MRIWGVSGMPKRARSTASLACILYLPQGRPRGKRCRCGCGKWRVNEPRQCLNNCILINCWPTYDEGRGARRRVGALSQAELWNHINWARKLPQLTALSFANKILFTNPNSRADRVALQASLAKQLRSSSVQDDSA